jgi:broad specificity phosphatase PhoE
VGTLLFIRHGQASFGAADYDQLSDQGRHQASVLGQSLAERQVKPARLVTGSLRRQRDTLELTARAAGWELEHEVDPRWDEFSHFAVEQPRDQQRSGESTDKYASRFDSAIDRWYAGEIDSAEPFEAFSRRVIGALEGARAGSGETHAGKHSPQCRCVISYRAG